MIRTSGVVHRRSFLEVFWILLQVSHSSWKVQSENVLVRRICPRGMGLSQPTKSTHCCSSGFGVLVLKSQTEQVFVDTGIWPSMAFSDLATLEVFSRWSRTAELNTYFRFVSTMASMNVTTNSPASCCTPKSQRRVVNATCKTQLKASESMQCVAYRLCGSDRLPANQVHVWRLEDCLADSNIQCKALWIGKKCSRLNDIFYAPFSSDWRILEYEAMLAG